MPHTATISESTAQLQMRQWLAEHRPANDNEPRFDHPDLHDVIFRPEPPLPAGTAIWHGGPSVADLIRRAVALNAANDNLPQRNDPITARAKKAGVDTEFALAWLRDIYEIARHAPAHPAGVPAMLDAQRRLGALAIELGYEELYTLLAGLDGATAEDVGKCYSLTYKRASAYGGRLTDTALESLNRYFFEIVPLAA